MENTIEQFKKIFNLSAYEARIYLSALNFTEANLTELSKKAGIPRTAAYPPLQSLLKQGFLSAIKIKKRTYYRAIEPKQLKFVLERKQIDLAGIIAGLEQTISKPDRKLDISYYNGVEGIQIAADIFQKEARTKLGKTWENLDLTVKQHGETQLNEYVKKWGEKGIKGQIIAPGNFDHPYVKNFIASQKDGNRKIILVSPTEYPIKASMGVIDDMFMIATFGDNPFAVLIKNQDIATTMWSIHNMVWDRYEK